LNCCLLSMQALVDPASERRHQDERQDRESSPLRPRRKRPDQRRPEADEDCGTTDEYEVKLGADEEQFRPEKDRAADYPSPPAHVTPRFAHGARAPAAFGSV